MKVEILTIFFGDKHLEMFEQTLIPSLYKKSNIPEMLNTGAEVSHRIYCPEREAEAISTYVKVSDVPVEIFTDKINPEDHAGLSTPVKESVQREVLTVMAPCDHVFGSGLWRAIKDVQPGEYMVCGHPRIESDRGLAPMQDFLKNNREDPDNRQLVQFCMESVQHPMVDHGKRVAEPYWHTIRRGDHWETHFAEPPPLAFWGQPYMMDAWTGRILFSHWEVIDHEMVQHCFLRDKLKWIDDSRVFFWSEFTEFGRYNPGLRQTLQSSWAYDCMKHLQKTPIRWYF